MSQDQSKIDLLEKIAGLEAQKDGAYSERNKVLSLLAVMAWKLGWKVGVGRHPEADTSWEDDWRTILFIELPTGQASWHFHDSEKHLLSGLPQYESSWDGHTTPEKYKRLESTRSKLFDEEDDVASDELIEEARELYADENIVIDNGALTSVGDDGTWVQAWVLVPSDENQEDQDGGVEPNGEEDPGVAYSVPSSTKE